MTITDDYISKLDDWLPDEKAIADLRGIIEPDGLIEYDSGRIKVPQSACYEVISKVLIKKPDTVGFGPGFYVLIAIGGMSQGDFGIVTSEYGFAILWYRLDGSLITVDFWDESPI